MKTTKFVPFSWPTQARNSGRSTNSVQRSFRRVLRTYNFFGETFISSRFCGSLRIVCSLLYSYNLPKHTCLWWHYITSPYPSLHSNFSHHVTFVANNTCYTMHSQQHYVTVLHYMSVILTLVLKKIVEKMVSARFL